MNMKMWLYLKKAEIGMSKERRYTLDAVTRLAVKRSPAEISEIKEKYCKNKLICEGTALSDQEEYLFQLLEAARREQSIPYHVRRKMKKMQSLIEKQDIDSEVKEFMLKCLTYSARLRPAELHELNGSASRELVTLFSRYLYDF